MFKLILTGILLSSASLLATIVVQESSNKPLGTYAIDSVEINSGYVNIIPHKNTPEHECMIPIQLVIDSGFSNVIEFSDSISRVNVKLHCLKKNVEKIEDFKIHYYVW
ncbi:MAG: hypothetical protein AB8E15_01420 [Bdellovibrionales bacterium]